MDDDGLALRQSQHDALNAIPAQDMLVDPAELSSVLEEPTAYGAVSPKVMAAWIIVSLVITILAAVWWAAARH